MASAQEEFQQKIIARIQDDIGEYLSEEVISELVQDVFRQAFFEPQRVPKDGRYDSGYTTKDSVLVQIVREEVASMTQKAVYQWLQQNVDLIREIVDHEFKRGLVTCIARSINSLVSTEIDTEKNRVVQRLKDNGVVDSNFYL